MEDFSIITKVLDRYFDFCTEPGEEYSLADMTEFIPEMLLDRSKPEDENGYSFWLPVKSEVTESHLSEFEMLLKHPLPGSYKYFLQQRYFLQLFLDADIDFFSNLPELLAKEFKEKIEVYYPELPARNYLPFASYRDYGVLAFDANKNALDNEYEIVMLDHEDGYKSTVFYAGNFISVFQQIDKKLDEKIEQITNYRDNS